MYYLDFMTAKQKSLPQDTATQADNETCPQNHKLIIYHSRSQNNFSIIYQNKIFSTKSIHFNLSIQTKNVQFIVIPYHTKN